MQSKRKAEQDDVEQTRYEARICDAAEVGRAFGGCAAAILGAIAAGAFGVLEGSLYLFAGEDPDGPWEP